MHCSPEVLASGGVFANVKVMLEAEAAGRYLICEVAEGEVAPSF